MSLDALPKRRRVGSHLPFLTQFVDRCVCAPVAQTLAKLNRFFPSASAMAAFERVWRKARSFAFAFASDNDKEATLLGIAVCFDAQVVHFVSLADDEWRGATKRVFAAQDRSGRVACKLTHTIRDSALTLVATLGLDVGSLLGLGLVDPLLELRHFERQNVGALHFVADRALPRRGLYVDAANLPPVEQALLRSAQAHAAFKHPLLVDVVAQCQLQSRVGVLLAEIEHAGVAIDGERLASVRARAAQLAQTCERRALELGCVSDLAGLRAVVLPNGERLSLQSLDASAHPAAVWWARARRLESILRHADSLAALVRAPGVVHCRFDAQHENGRINSLEPNLQCLPKALSVIVPDASGSTDDEQFALRGCVVARPGCALVSADFRQMELRIVAALSGEQRLLANGDAFVAVAALCGAGVSRAVAKEVFYADLYGACAATIAAVLKCTKDRAAAVQNELRAAFPVLRAWREQVLCECRAAGNVVVSPAYGTRRHIADLSASDEFARQAGERRAINALVQGTASDIFKTVMLNVHMAIRDLGARILLPLHDELLVEVASERVPVLEALLLEHMCVRVCADSLRLEVAIRSGARWSDLV
jgi:hypothetical protein